MWYRCLYVTTGTDLRKSLRAGVSADEMRALIRAGWEGRRDRGAEESKALERDGLRVGGLIDIGNFVKIPISRCTLAAVDVPSYRRCPCPTGLILSRPHAGY